MTKRINRGADAFTLLEVLVASAVLGILLLILLGSVTTTLSTWRVTEDRMGADREGRSAFQVIADDLANAVVPTNPALWPQIRSNGSWIGFLTLKPTDYQDSGAGDIGDVCYVEYHVQPQTGANAIFRRFVGSKETFGAVALGQMPSNSETALAQLLATNVISNNIALKGTAIVRSSSAADVNAVRTNFTALILSNGIYSVTNATSRRPDAIQVSIGVADIDALRNPQLLANTNIQLRGGGYYSFTVNLPSP